MQTSHLRLLLWRDTFLTPLGFHYPTPAAVHLHQAGTLLPSISLWHLFLTCPLFLPILCRCTICPVWPFHPQVDQTVMKKSFLLQMIFDPHISSCLPRWTQIPHCPLNLLLCIGLCHHLCLSFPTFSGAAIGVWDIMFLSSLVWSGTLYSLAQ